MLTAVLVAYLGATVVLLVVALTTLIWMLDSWRTPESIATTRFAEPDEPRLSFSLLVPARHEERCCRTPSRGCWSRTTRTSR